MTKHLSKGPDGAATLMSTMRPDEYHAFVERNQTKNPEDYVKMVVDELSDCARHTVWHNDPNQRLHIRLLALYADRDSMTCRKAERFIRSVAPALDPAITRYQSTLSPFQTYGDNLDAAAKKGLTDQEPFSSRSFTEKWPDSFQLEHGSQRSKTRDEMLWSGRKIMGFKEGEPCKDLNDHQPTGNELLRDAVRNTAPPDLTISGDLEKWLGRIHLGYHGKPISPPKRSQAVVWPMNSTPARGEKDNESRGTEFDGDTEGDEELGDQEEAQQERDFV